MNKFEQMGFKMGLKPDKKDHRDFVMFLPPLKKELPEKFDLKDKIKIIFKQKYNDCSSNVISNCIMSLREDDKIVSRLFQYFNSRYIHDPVFICDEGSSYRDALKALQKYGYAFNEDWAYIDEHLDQQPDENTYKIGEQNRFFIRCYRKIYPIEHNIKQTLFLGYLIMFGVAIYESFLHLDEKFCVPYPCKASETLVGFHAILAVGWNNDIGFLCCNSWGSGWGDKGYFYLPFKYVLDPDLSCDFWTIHTSYSS